MTCWLVCNFRGTCEDDGCSESKSSRILFSVLPFLCLSKLFKVFFSCPCIIRVYYATFSGISRTFHESPSVLSVLKLMDSLLKNVWEWMFSGFDIFWSQREKFVFRLWNTTEKVFVSAFRFNVLKFERFQFLQDFSLKKLVSSQIFLAILPFVLFICK